jgi:hypothetical protein
VRKFEARGIHVDGWGRDKFISNTILRDPSNGNGKKQHFSIIYTNIHSYAYINKSHTNIGFIVDNKIIFKVEITVHGDLDHPQHQKTLQIPRTVNSLKNDLSKILFQKSTSDCTLIVGEEESSMETINAHKAILCARSPVFHAMLQSRSDGYGEEMKFGEGFENTVRISDMEPDVMRSLCTYMYTETCSDATLNVNADKILRAATKYQVLGLVNVTEEFLSRNISIQNACDMLYLADLYCAGNLR